MRTVVFPWLGKEFVALSGEGKAGLPPGEAVRDLMTCFAAELKDWGLSLDNTVRSRLWGRDREARDGGSRERVAVLAGRARSASASFIAPLRIDSGASVALDLLAMRPAIAGQEKRLQEYEPPITPLRYLVYDGIAFLSGVTHEEGTLDVQLNAILPRIGGSLAHAGASWGSAVRMSCFLHRSQKLEDLKMGLQGALGRDLPGTIEYTLVDGYSTPGKLVEIEVTAVVR